MNFRLFRSPQHQAVALICLLVTGTGSAQGADQNGTAGDRADRILSGEEVSAAEGLPIEEMPRPTGSAAERPEPDLAAGRAAYMQSCARCHGDTGQADGVDAKRFYPRPRDFTMGTYKFRSTLSGTPPTDEDLFASVSHGLPGTNMPDWQFLDEATRRQIVAYLKTLSPIFNDAAPEPVRVSDDPGPKKADRKTGRAIYEKLGCAACHGDVGRANGTSAAGIVDDWGMPLRPANLTQGWSYRGGSDPRSIMLRFLSGIDGAGMPSYADVISSEEAWHLAYYVVSLQEAPHWNPVATPHPVKGKLPTTINDSRWKSAEPTDVRLRNAVNADGEWASPPTITKIGFQVVHTEDTIAFRITWDDPSQEAQLPTPDALAILLKPTGAQGDTVTLQAWPYDGAPALDVCYWSADSELAVEGVAKDFNALREKTASGSALPASAHYENGRWQLVLTRPLHPQSPEGAAPIQWDRFSSVAFAVWDGGNPEARAISSWTDLGFRSKTEAGDH